MLCGLAVAALACAGTGGRSLEATRPTPEDDVVSVGYGTQSRRQITGAVSSYTPTEADARFPRVELMLQGRIPGLQIVPVGNGTYTLKIRGSPNHGQSWINDEPLLVIDDIAVTWGSVAQALAGISPRDVARVDVLKDASASIYGSRGANGVIIITTKRAR
jgi:TonB-dependent SusC/RagA subfamily outer membrane receptor